MRCHRSLILHAAFLALAVFGVAPAHAAQTGIVPDLTWGVSRSVQDRTASDMTELGAGWSRMNISWSDWTEPSKGSYSSSAFSSIDRGIDLARAAGYRVMVTVEESPAWARDSDIKNHPPRDNGDLADFMAYVANRYVGRVEAYQVWNEPNVAWAWPSGPDPAEYAHMLRTVSPAIRAADPNAKVVFAGLNTNDYSFLEGAYDAVPDLGRYFDVMATHPYTWGNAPPEKVMRDGNGRISKGAFAGYREVHQTMVNHGDSKPIWFTEFGWATYTGSKGVSPATQASYLTRALRCVEEDPYVEVAYWYNLRNSWWENDANTWSGQLGLMSTDFTRKPAFDALENYVPGTGTCNYSADATPGPVPATDPAPGDTDPGTDPEPAPSTDEPAPSTDEPTVVSSSVRESSLLAVRRARIRQGRLLIRGRMARGATGRVTGVAHYSRRSEHFAARIDRRGRIEVSKRLPGMSRRGAARVRLVYRGNYRYLEQRVAFYAGTRSARLRVRPAIAQASSSMQHATVTGTVARSARGSLRVKVTYDTANGGTRVLRDRARIRNGDFRSSLSLPASASSAVLQVTYRGDRERGIGGASVARRVNLG
jgi:hypothetical protein